MGNYTYAEALHSATGAIETFRYRNLPIKVNIFYYGSMDTTQMSKCIKFFATSDDPSYMIAKIYVDEACNNTYTYGTGIYSMQGVNDSRFYEITEEEASSYTNEVTPMIYRLAVESTT